MSKSATMNMDIDALSIVPGVLGETLARIPTDVPVVILGSPGIGKTMIVGDSAKKSGAKLIPKLTTTMEAVDFSGIPFPEGKVTDWKVPNFLFDASTDAPEKIPHWIFLDEITSATEDVQKAALKWIHERGDGRLFLRENVRWILAGNLATDRVGAGEMLKTLSSRCVTVYVKADAESFCNWGRDEGNIHPWVVGFLRRFPQRIMTFNPDSSDPSFACPRSFENLSKIIQKNGDHTDGMLQIYAGTIGMGVASEFLAYVRQAEKCISPDEIVKDPNGARVPEVKDIDILHATVAALESYLKKHPSKNWKAGLIYAQRIQTEIGILLAKHVFSLIIKDLSETERLDALKSKEWADVTAKWKQYLIRPAKRS